MKIYTIIILSLIALKGSLSTTPEYEDFLNRIKIKHLSKQEFYDYLSIPESAGKYDIANKYLMVGKYQASFIALKTFGYEDSTIKKIRASIYSVKNSKGIKLYYFDIKTFPKKEQERFIRWYMYQMEHIYLKKYITEYEGRYIAGVKITKAGILGSSILGHKYVKDFLKNNGNDKFADAYGTTIYKRMQYFENIFIE